VPGVLLDYNLFASHYQPNDGSSTDNVNTYGTAGANMGAWRLRGDYQYTQTHTDAGSENDGRFSRLYMFRPLPRSEPNSHWVKRISSPLFLMPSPIPVPP
jgi:outer membrane usher protein FimD/PapC